jgi:hypothetical protein
MAKTKYQATTDKLRLHAFCQCCRYETDIKSERDFQGTGVAEEKVLKHLRIRLKWSETFYRYGQA